VKPRRPIAATRVYLRRECLPPISLIFRLQSDEPEINAALKVSSTLTDDYAAPTKGAIPPRD